MLSERETRPDRARPRAVVTLRRRARLGDDPRVGPLAHCVVSPVRLSNVGVERLRVVWALEGVGLGWPGSLCHAGLPPLHGFTAVRRRMLPFRGPAAAAAPGNLSLRRRAGPTRPGTPLRSLRRGTSLRSARAGASRPSPTSSTSPADTAYPP